MVFSHLSRDSSYISILRTGSQVVNGRACVVVEKELVSLEDDLRLGENFFDGDICAILPL